MRKVIHTITLYSCLFFLPGLLKPLSVTGQNTDEINNYLSDLPFAKPEISLPQIPDKEFNIKDFGAVGDGQTLNSKAFKKVFETCAENGGGKIIVPPGIWLTGPIEFKSNVNLVLEKGAIILLSKNHDDYPIIENPINKSFMVASPVYGFGLKNIAITGQGVIDGSGETWRPVKKYKRTEEQWNALIKSGGVVSPDGNMYWPTQQAMDGAENLKKLKDLRKERKDLTAADYLPVRDYLRPYMILFYRCNTVLFDGPTFQNSPKFVLYPQYCENMVVRNIKVLNEWWYQNGDGIDIAGGKNVLIYNCTVSVGDDGICMKSTGTKNYDVNPTLQNVVIADCKVYHGHGGFVIGSNTNGGISNVSVKNCDFMGTDIGLRFKSARNRGGLVENIFIDGICMKNIVSEAILFNTYYENMGKDEDNKPVEVNDRTPRFQKFNINNVYCNGAARAIKMVGLPEMPIQQIDLSNIVISAKQGVLMDYSKDIQMDSVNIIPLSGDMFQLINSSKVHLKNVSGATSDVFLKVEGENSTGITLKNCDLSKSKTQVNLGDKVDKKAVTIE